MKKTVIQLLLAVSLMVSACGGSSTPPTVLAPGDIPKIEFEKYTLANGLEVILSEDRRLPLVAVDVWYHVGPANEAAGRTGFAHLFEHMMFQGSKHVPGDSHFRLLEASGGTNLNGTTNFDRTNYFETLPANQLELGLWLESDRMGYLLDTVDVAKLANQQDVVRNERRQNTENSPYGIVNEALFQTIFPKGHSYYGNVIGSHADIQAAKLEDVKGFFKQYYAPNNASIAIVGDFDKAKTKVLVEKYFGPLKRGPDVPKITVTTPPITSERRAVVTDRVELPRVFMAWITPAFFKPGDADADLTASVLGGGDSSRLYKKLVYEKQIAQDVSAFQYSLALGSTFQIVATVRPGHTPQEVEKAIDEELNLLRQSGPEEKEVARARNTFETGMLQGLEVLGGFGGVADTLSMFNHYVGDPGYLPKYLEEHRNVTPASVKAFVGTYLQPNTRVVIHGMPGPQKLAANVPTMPAPKVAPGTGVEAINADAPWRATQPKPAEGRAINLPTPRSFKLANGLTVLFHERPGMPVVAADLVIRTGGDANPVDRPGLANFTASMLDQGTASRNALQLADDIAQLGAAINATSSKDASIVSVGSLRKNFPAALDLLADVALRPTFPEAEVERQRKSRLARIIAQRAGPGHGGDDRHRGGALRERASVRIRGARHRSVRQRDEAGRPPGLLEEEFRPRQRRAHRRRRDRGGGAENARREGVRRVAGRHGNGDGAELAVDDQESRRARRSTRRAADRALRGADRPAAIDARLRRRVGHERRAGRTVLEPRQPQSSREARIHLRRVFAVRVPEGQRPVLDQRARPHRRDGRGGQRNLQRGQADDDDADDARGAGDGQGLDRPRAAERLRDERGHGRQPREPVHLRSRPRLLHKAAVAGHRGHR